MEHRLCHPIMPSTKPEMKMLAGPEALNPNETGIPFQLFHVFNLWDIPVVSQHLQNKWDSKIFDQTDLKTVKLLQPTHVKGNIPGLTLAVRRRHIPMAS